MAATYIDTEPTDKDKIRRLIGDVDVSAAMVTDEHIAAVQVTAVTVNATAVALAQELLTRFQYDPVSWTADGATFNFGSRIPGLKDLIARLAGTSGGIVAVPANYTGATATDEYARHPFWWTCR